MPDLSVSMCGLKLKNPLIVGAGPNTKNITTALNSMKAGFGGIVVRSLHMQHADDVKVPTREMYRVYGNTKDFTKHLYSFQSTGAPVRTLRPDNAPGWGGAAPVPTLEQWTEEVAKITRAARDYDCAIIASLGWCGSNLTDESLWTTEAAAMEKAGAHAIELHTGPSPATEPGRYMTMDPDHYLAMPIRAARKGTRLPIFAKIPVDCCDSVGMAQVAQAAGADGVVPVTRWSTITVDIEHDTEPEWRGPGMGGPWSVPIMNGLIFRMRHADRPISYLFSKTQGKFPKGGPVTIPIVPSGGVRSGSDVIQYMIMGGDAVQVCAQVILEGVQIAGRIQKEMGDWMTRKGYSKIGDFRGTARLLEAPQAASIPQWLPVVDKAKCTGCERCVKACPNVALSLHDKKAQLDERFCEGCRTCFYVCPVNAISLSE